MIVYTRQAEVAERLKKPQSFIRKCESDERRLDVLGLLDVCEVINLSLSEFAKKLERRLDR